MLNTRKYIFDAAKLIFPFILFTIILIFRVPQSFSQTFSSYSGILFLVFLLFLYVTFRLPAKYQFITFSLILFVFAMTLSYNWTSGFSDNRIIGGLLPYKDGKSYYDGASLILNGERLNAGRSTWRPLFPAFFSSILWFMGQNLKASLAILVAMVGIGSFLSAQEISKAWGALPASLYAAFLYFFVQYFIGITATELLGVTLGCVAFILLFRTANHPRWFDIILGLVMLMIAVSARAGAFFIFPLLIIWVGWIFRGANRFSIRAALVASIIIFFTYLLGNTVLRYLIGAEGGSSFGNFAFSLYGQVRGGTGWHSAIDTLGTRDTSKIFRAALLYFVDNPFSFILASLKSYRDFFLPGTTGIFIFAVSGKQAVLGTILWIVSLGLLTFGIIRLSKHIRLNVSSLLIASFIGILLSIPFLPPIDGGSRFYASTMPFFFALVSAGLGSFPVENPKIISETEYSHSMTKIRMISIVLLILAMPLPLVNHFIQRPEKIDVPECSFGQSPFVVKVTPGSYIDIVRKQEATCGLAPGICYEDFDRNGDEKGVDDFYDQLLALAGSSKKGIRIIPAHNLVDWKSHYFVQDFDRVSNRLDNRTISGCATKIMTMNQSIYFVESVYTSE